MEISIGIIGLGPRGLTILERIIANERIKKSKSMRIYLFDPNEAGVGCHSIEQPDYLLVNTVAGQITLFSDLSMKDVSPVMEGPSFYQWLKDQQNTPLLKDKLANSIISSDHYYSRKLFGYYLQYVYNYLLKLKPNHIEIQFIKQAVVSAQNLKEQNENKKINKKHPSIWLLKTESHPKFESESEFKVDYLFLTTGHTKPKSKNIKNKEENNKKDTPENKNRTIIIDDPYPIKETLSFINQNHIVAIEGMGLTTFDVLSELTIGKGGRFITNNQRKNRQYIASGHEPKIIAFSRSGLPLTSRAVNQKGISAQYYPRFLTLEKVRQLKTSLCKLDFEIDIFPLLLLDMEYAYYEAYLKEKYDFNTAMLFCNHFVCVNQIEREKLIADFIPLQDQLTWNQMVSPIPQKALETCASFEKWLKDYLQQDLKEAIKGTANASKFYYKLHY